MKCFAFNAAGTQSYTPTFDQTLTFVVINSGIALVTTNPTRAITDITAPATLSQFDDVIVFATPTGLRSPIAFPFRAGEKYFVVSNATGSVFLQLDPVILP